jgi:hypothetical protein
MLRLLSPTLSAPITHAEPSGPIPMSVARPGSFCQRPQATARFLIVFIEMSSTLDCEWPVAASNRGDRLSAGAGNSRPLCEWQETCHASGIRQVAVRESIFWGVPGDGGARRM